MDRVRLRVRTEKVEGGRLPRGQNTIVEVIDKDGNAKMLEGVAALTIRVAARHEHVGIMLEGNFELDIEGIGEKAKEPKDG